MFYFDRLLILRHSVAIYYPIVLINKGAEHRNICRKPQKVSYKVQRTGIYNARILCIVYIFFAFDTFIMHHILQIISLI